MSRRFLARLGAIALVVGVLPALQVLPAAEATVVPVSYTCTTAAFGVDFVDSPQSLSLDVTVPAIVAVGTPLDVNLAGFVAPKGPPTASTGVTLSVTASVGVRKQGTTPVTVAPSTTSAPFGPTSLAVRQTMPVTANGVLSAATTSFAAADVLEVIAGPIVYTWVAGDDGMAGATMTCLPTTTTVLATSTAYSSANRCIADVTCATSQRIESEVVSNPNGLTQAQLDNQTNLGTVTTRAYDQTLTANLDSVYVADVRGNNLGWSQSAFVTNFVGSPPSLTIPANRLSVTPVCTPSLADVDGNVVAAPQPGSTCVAGSPATFAGAGSGDAVTLATTPDVPTGSGGVWKVDVSASLSVPAYQAASTYQATITIVLTSN